MTTEAQEHFDLSALRALIGKEVEPTEHDKYLMTQPIDKSEIRFYAVCLDDCNPLWLDEQYARKTRWGGIMARSDSVTPVGRSTDTILSADWLGLIKVKSFIVIPPASRRVVTVSADYADPMSQVQVEDIWIRAISGIRIPRKRQTARWASAKQPFR